MMIAGKLFVLMAAAWTFLILPAGLSAEDKGTLPREWSAEIASDLGKGLNRMQLLVNSGVSSPADRSGPHDTSGDVDAGVAGFLTVVVGGVNTAMEGQRLGPGAFGLETLAHGLYSGSNVQVVPIRYGDLLPDMSKLGRNVIVTVDMDLDFYKPSRPLSFVSGFPALQSQARWGGEMIRQLFESYKQAYPNESIFGLGHSAGSLAIARGIEQGAPLDKIVLFSPIMAPSTLADLAQAHGLRPDQVLAVRGAGDPLNRGVDWDSYAHAFQHLYVKEILVGGQPMAPGHSGMIPWTPNARPGLGLLGVDAKALVEGSFLRNWGLTAPTQVNSLSSLMMSAVMRPTVSIGSSPAISRTFNYGNFPGGLGR